MACQSKEAPPPNPERMSKAHSRKPSQKRFKHQPRKKRIFAKHSREQKPTNMEQRMQNTTKNTRVRQDNKNNSSLPKMDLKTKPKKKRIFAKHFREQKAQQICKNIGKTPLKNTRRQQDNKEQRLAPENGSQKPNLRRREFLPRIFGNRKPNKYAKT